MATKKKSKSGSVKVDPPVLEEAKKICTKKGLIIGVYVTSAIKLLNTQHNENSQ